MSASLRFGSHCVSYAAATISTLFIAPAIGAAQACVVRDRSADRFDHASSQDKLAAERGFPRFLIRIAPDQRNPSVFAAVWAGCLYGSQPGCTITLVRHHSDTKDR